MASDVIVINAAQMKVKTRASGKARTVVTMTVKSEPITYNISPAALLTNAAVALASQIRQQTEDIQAKVKPSTAKARETAERAYAAGKSWAVRRYSGGRMGATPPRFGEQRQFNHSGRLAKSIVARYQEKAREFYINYAANRWRVEDFRSPAHMDAAVQRWISLVPVLQDPGADIEVQRAFQRSHNEMVEKHRMGIDKRRAEAAGQLAVRVLQLAAQALGG